MADLIVKKASAYTAAEKVVLGITGIPDNWPIESAPYTGSVPNGWEQMTDTELAALKANNQASYDAWLQTLRPLPSDPPINPDYRPVVHTTPRKRGLITYFTGADDDHTDPHKYGGDSNISELYDYHGNADSQTETFYLDFNTINNETFVHAGFLQWKDALNNSITLEIVPKTTAYGSGSNTNYNLYGGYLIIPAAGNGTTTVNNNDRVLVQVPTNEFGVKQSAGYWDATWNTSTKVFDNITANANGTGAFNMFGAEVILDRFLNKQSMLGSHAMPMPTADAAMLGHNMRVKCTIVTRGTNHAWYWNASLVMHRKKTV